MRGLHRLGTTALALFAWTVLVTACGTQTEMPPEAGAESSEEAGPAPSVSMVGDTALIELPMGRSGDNGEIVVRFDGVTEDSRCPRDVQCVWEGNAGVRLTLTSEEETEVVILNSALQPTRVLFGGYSVGFRELRPYPVSRETRDRDTYVATLAVVDTR